MRTIPLIAMIAIAVTANAAADWPQFRGPSGQGVADDKGVPITWSADKNVLWKVELPGAGTSSPVVVGERIFLTCFTGYNVPGKPGGNMEQLQRSVTCLNAKDGKLIWDKPVPSKLPEQTSIREGHGYATSTPVADAESVYAFFGISGVFAFDHSGKQLWHFPNVGGTLNGWGSAAPLMQHGDLLIVNASVESECLIALNKKTGKEVWRARGIRESWAMPILVPINGKAELVVPILGKILAFDPASGEPLWSCKTDIAWYMVPSLVAHDGVIYCVGGRSGGGLAVRAGGRGDVTQSHRLWKGNKGSNVTSPIFHDGHLYWMHEGLGIAFCAEAKSGRIVYEERINTPGGVYASTVLAEGRIYYVSRLGQTLVVAAEPQFKLLATNTLEKRIAIDASPAVTNGRLLLRTNQHLYCIGER